MSLRRTILSAVALTFIGLVVLMLVNIQTILSSHFAREEEQSVSLDVQRARGVLSAESSQLEQIVKEWARRADVNDFAARNSGAQLPALLNEANQTGAEVNVVVLVDQQGNATTSFTYGAGDPTGLAAQLTAHQGEASGRTGLIHLASGPLLLAASPTTSTGGLVAVGRYLDASRLALIRQRFSLALELYPIGSADLPADVRQAEAALSQGAAQAIYPAGTESVAGYFHLNDLAGQPTYILRVSQPRSIFYSGQLVTNFLIIFLAVTGLVFALLISLLLERLVLSRLSRLSCEVAQIGQSGDLSRQVTLSQHDELTQLGENINAMLAELRQRVSELQALHEASQVLLGQLDMASTLDSICRLAVEKLGLRTAWIGHNWASGSQLAPVAAADAELASLPAVEMSARSSDQALAARALVAAQAIFEDGKAAIPIQNGSDPLAVLALDCREGETFTPSRQRQALAFAAQAGLALQSARLYGQVRTAQRRLEMLSQRLVQVQEDERRRIAQELHDEIGQTLTGLKLVLDTSASQPEKAAQAGQMVNELIGQVRQMSLDLRPAMLDDLGLLPALLWLIDRYTHQTGIEVEFAHAGLEGRRFASEVEITAYRVVQEALTNIARYAGVSQASVGAWLSAEALMLQISDQGRGFDFDAVAQQKEGRGLLGMRERVQFVGGKLYIDSRPGQGTEILAELPIKEES